MKTILCSTLVAVALAPAAAFAQSAQPSEPEGTPIVVTASRSGDAVRADQLGASVTVLDAEALERRQTRDVADILRDVPGVAVGQVPGLTQLRLRGSEANHVLVLIDGIEVSDPYAGEFDFSTLIADPGARIEVLRGQQSALYGSDAIGGVINYITASGREAPGASARIEGGSFGTVNAAARFGGAGGTLDYSATASLVHTGGTPNARGGTRDLGRDSGALALKADWQAADNLTLTAVGRWSRTEADFNREEQDPSSPRFGTIVDTPGTYFVNQAHYGLVRAQLDLLGGRWTHAVSGQLADTTRDGYQPGGRYYGDEGRRWKASYVTALRLGEGTVRHRLTFALDWERERYRNTDPSGFAFTGARHTDNLGLVGQYELLVGERLALGGAVRRDDNDLFADATTYRVQGSYRLGTGTRLHGAAGSGIKNPGYFELYGYVSGRYVGNPNLRPERSEGWEAGVEQTVARGAVAIGATYFQSRLEDEIVTRYPAPAFVQTPINLGSRSRQRGVETYLRARVAGRWRVDAAYTYLHAREGGQEEIRRPAHVASVAVDWRAAGDRGGLTLVARHTGASDDLAYPDPSFVPVRVRLGAYTLVNLNGDFALTDRLSLFARAENLLGERYEQVFSYTNPGRAAYAGLRARF